MKVDNAIIMAAGTSSRFAPLSYEKPKSLTEVKGEILIERQIRQLKDAGVPEIFIVTGYKAHAFTYLTRKFGVKLIHNPDYMTRNNNASIWAARYELKNSYICSSDNYFSTNPFEADVDSCYYAAEYAEKETPEWCMEEDKNGYIKSITIGGAHAWYMLGHTFWDNEFSQNFLKILEKEYDRPETKDKLWEKIFAEHLDVLKMKIRKYGPNVIFEFDTMDELRAFDKSYISDSRSRVLKQLSEQLQVPESEITQLTAVKDKSNEAIGFRFNCPKGSFSYAYENRALKRI